MGMRRKSPRFPADPPETSQFVELAEQTALIEQHSHSSSSLLHSSEQPHAPATRWPTRLLGLLIAAAVAGALLFLADSWREDRPHSACSDGHASPAALWAALPEATRAAATAYGFPVTGASALSESLVSAGLLLLLDFSERDALNAFAAAAADSPGCPLCLGLSALAHVSLRSLDGMSKVADTSPSRELPTLCAQGPSLNRVPLESGKEGFGWAADDMAEAVHAARDAVGLARAVGIDRGDADPDWLLLQALSDRCDGGRGH